MFSPDIIENQTKGIQIWSALKQSILLTQSETIRARLSRNAIKKGEYNDNSNVTTTSILEYNLTDVQIAQRIMMSLRDAIVDHFGGVEIFNDDPQKPSTMSHSTSDIDGTGGMLGIAYERDGSLKFTYTAIGKKSSGGILNNVPFSLDPSKNLQFTINNDGSYEIKNSDKILSSSLDPQPNISLVGRIFHLVSSISASRTDNSTLSNVTSAIPKV